MSTPDNAPEITADDAGTWVGGWHGVDSPALAIDKAEAYGFTVPDDYARALYNYRTHGHGAHVDDWEAVNGQGELSDMATDYLNDHAPEGYLFRWDAGELSMLRDFENCAADGNGCEIVPAIDATETDKVSYCVEHSACEGHYDDDVALTSGVPLGGAYYCDGACVTS